MVQQKLGAGRVAVLRTQRQSALLLVVEQIDHLRHELLFSLPSVLEQHLHHVRIA